MYAWSNFKAEVNEWGTVTKWIRVGEEVSQSDLNVSDEEWQELVDSGAVREEEYPDVAGDQSPQEYWNANPDERPEATVDVTSSPEDVIKADALDQRLPTEVPGIDTGEKENANTGEPEKETWRLS